jgi:hypothetical protein
VNVSLLDAAESYAARGWAVFPVGPDKRPLTEHGFKDATTDDDAIVRLWTGRPDAGIGVPVPAGCFVLDVDPRNGGDITLASLITLHDPLPPTVRARTGGGGEHLWFRLPATWNGAKLPAKIGAGLDIRAGSKAYVVVPPSPHLSGHPYAWMPYGDPEEQTIAEAPTWLVELLTTPDATTHGIGVAAFSRLMAGVPEGERDETIFRYACDLRRRFTPRDEAEALVLAVAGRCKPAFPDSEALKKVEQAWKFPAGSGGASRDESKDPTGQLDGPPAEGPETASPPRAETLRLSKVESRELRWFWKSRIPRGAITMHDGDPDLGKSITWIDMAARCSRAAGEFPDGEPCDGPKTTLLLSAEDPVETVIRPRFDAAGGDPEKVVLLRSVRRRRDDAPDLFSLSSDLGILEEVVQQLRPDMIVIDPITAYLGAVNSWKDQEVRRVLAPLAALAEKYDSAVILIRHLNKATKVESVLYRGGGSIGIIGAARSGLLSAKDPDDPERRLLATYKHNLARGAETLAYRTVPSPDNPAVPIVEWLGSDARSAEQINAAAGETYEQKSTRGDARGFLKEVLADGPMPAEDVYADAKKAGITRMTLKRASADLKIVKAKQGFQGAWSWSLS